MARLFLWLTDLCTLGPISSAYCTPLPFSAYVCLSDVYNPLSLPKIRPLSTSSLVSPGNSHSRVAQVLVSLGLRSAITRIVLCWPGELVTLCLIISSVLYTSSSRKPLLTRYSPRLSSICLPSSLTPPFFVFPWPFSKYWVLMSICPAIHSSCFCDTFILPSLVQATTITLLNHCNSLTSLFASTMSPVSPTSVFWTLKPELSF